MIRITLNLEVSHMFSVHSDVMTVQDAWEKRGAPKLYFRQTAGKIQC